MDDPNTTNVLYSQPDPQAGQDTQSVQPASMPVGGEKGIAGESGGVLSHEHKAVEIHQIESEPKLKPENEPIYERPRPQEPDQKQQEPQSQATPVTTKSEPKPNVVDKSKDMTQLHHLANTHDKLTNKADQEEEEFITEVETVHGHK